MWTGELFGPCGSINQWSKEPAGQATSGHHPGFWPPSPCIAVAFPCSSLEVLPAPPRLSPTPLCRPVPPLPQNVHEYEDKEFANVSKEDLKLADTDEKEKKAQKKLKVRWAAFCSAAHADALVCCAVLGQAGSWMQQAAVLLPGRHLKRKQGRRALGIHAAVGSRAGAPPLLAPHSLAILPPRAPSTPAGGVQGAGSVVEGGAGGRRGEREGVQAPGHHPLRCGGLQGGPQRLHVGAASCLCSRPRLCADSGPVIAWLLATRAKHVTPVSAGSACAPAAAALTGPSDAQPPRSLRLCQCRSAHRFHAASCSTAGPPPWRRSRAPRLWATPSGPSGCGGSAAWRSTRATR